MRIAAVNDAPRQLECHDRAPAFSTHSCGDVLAGKSAADASTGNYVLRLPTTSP